MERLDELGFYTLAGHTDSPRDLLDEAREAEALGLGSAFVSERFNLKDASTLCGAVAAVTESLGIATAATNHNTRHPMVTATFATTMHRLSGGRFALGLGRGFDRLFKGMGLEPITSAQLQDAADILRRLWKGEMILGHDGPAGTYPYLHQDADFDEDIPLMLVALGEKTIELAGRCMDGVVLHHTWTDEGVLAGPAANGAQLLHLSVALCVVNDTGREAERLGIEVDGVAVEADGGFDEEWRSSGTNYCVTLDARAPLEDLARLGAVVDKVAEIPRAVRSGAPVERRA